MNRRNVALVGLALVPATVTTSWLSPVAKARRKKRDKKPKRRPRTKIVTRTFSNTRWIRLPSTGTSGIAAPYPSTIDVEGLTRGRILDVNLTLHGFSHGFPENVDMMLVAPNGQGAVVMSEAGDGIQVSGLTITLDDQAAAPLPRSRALSSGAFQPANYDDFEPEIFPAPALQGITPATLATFNGAYPNGRWQLFVVEDAGPDSGMITGGWSLTIRARMTTRP